MRPLLAAFVVLAAGLVPVEAARAPGGGAVRAVRRRAVDAVQVFEFVGTYAYGKLRGLSTPRRGERYTIVDDGGAIAEVIVTSVDTIRTDGCPGEFYVEATVQLLVELGVRRGGQAYAVGPNKGRLERARRVDPVTVAAPPQPTSFDRRLDLVFDRDGDRSPDVFVYQSYCDGARLAPWGQGKQLCVEVWAAEGRSVEATTRARTAVCGVP